MSFYISKNTCTKAEASAMDMLCERLLESAVSYSAREWEDTAEMSRKLFASGTVVGVQSILGRGWKFLIDGEEGERDCGFIFLSKGFVEVEEEIFPELIAVAEEREELAGILGDATSGIARKAVRL